MATEPEKKTTTTTTTAKSVSQLEELESLRKEVRHLTSQVSKLEEDNEALTQQIADLKQDKKELRADARGFDQLVAELHSITDQINSAGDLRLDTVQVDELQVKLRMVMSELKNLTN